MTKNRPPSGTRPRQKTSRHRQELRPARRSNQLTIDSSLIQRAMADPAALTPADVLRLQRTVGNRTVQRILAGNEQSKQLAIRQAQPGEVPRSFPEAPRVHRADNAIQRWRPDPPNLQIEGHLNTIEGKRLHDFVPSSGIGKFDARFDPRPEIGVLHITVKLFFNFQGTWSQKERDEFRDGFIQKAEEAWSGKFTMRCTKPGWQGLVAKPQVHALSVDNIDNSHYDIKINKGSGQAKVGRQHFHDHTIRPDALFYQNDINAAPQSKTIRQNMVEEEGRRIQNLITGNDYGEIGFKLYRAKITDNKLNQFISALRSSRRPGSPPVPINVTGFSNKREVGIYHLARRRAGNVAGALENVDRIIPFEKVGTDKDRKAIIDVPYNDPDMIGEIAGKGWGHGPPPEKYRDQWPDYTASVHEFGHMLGNPDEYVGGATGDVATIQENYKLLVESAGLTAPVYGKRTSSLMSAGTDLLIHHYTPLWDALVEITDGIIDRNQWKLE